MVWCNHCAKEVAGFRPDDSALDCNLCGRILENFYFSEEVTRERRISAAREELMNFRDALQIGDGDDSDGVFGIASRFFVRSADRNFTKGRRSELVLASCLYFACRRKDLPVLLIDLSSYLGVAVCELGSVFLQLCKEAFYVYNYEELVDPSVFIPRFTNGLLKSGHDDETTTKVIGTAMNIMASMKGDWVQTGRKLSGICGAAIYIAALSHDIADMGEETITYILNDTEAASLTVEVLEKPFTRRQNSDKEVVNCKHKDSKSFSYGLCKDCHEKFMKVSAALRLSEKSESHDLFDLDGDPVESKKLSHPASTAFEAWTRMHRSKGLDDFDFLKEHLDHSRIKKKEDKKDPEEDEEQDKK